MSQLQSHKRQFKGTAKPRLFFDRLVRETGNTRSLSLGKAIPQGWGYVRIEVIDRESDSVTVRITKLLERLPNAPDTKANKGSEQDT